MVAARPVEHFLEALFGAAPSRSLLELRWRTKNGMCRAFHLADALDDVASAVKVLGRTTDVYIGVLPRTRRGGGRDDLVPFAHVLWADCDTPHAAASLRRFKPPPSMVVRSGSGSNRHAYWLLARSASVDSIERANSRLADALGADIACAEPARILRPPSLNHKHDPPTPVRLESCDVAACHQLEDVMRHLPATAHDYLPRRSRHSPRTTADPLLALSPTLYVEHFTAVRVPRDGKIACPFHVDATPSLHVYREPWRGWYCYGCRRGGSIYDFAGLFWGYETRGAAYAELRARLSFEFEAKS